MFFSGDKPASQFERGTQVGGNYHRVDVMQHD